MRYKLLTLSPIHIGNGNQINNWSYGLNGEKIKIYDFDKVIKDLKNNNEILINLTHQIEKYPLSKDLGSFLGSLHILPQYECDLKANLRRTNRRTNQQEYKQIWEFIKERGKVYIPGTEIKGAIRTAMFYYLLDKNSKLKGEFFEIFIQALKKSSLFDKNSEGYKNCHSNEFFQRNLEKCTKRARNQEEIEKCKERFEKQVNNCIKKLFLNEINSKIKSLEKRIFTDGNDDIHYDFMKFLLVSDAFNKKKNNSDLLQVVDIVVVGSRKGQTPHEVVKFNKGFEFSINFPDDKTIKMLEKKGYPNISLLTQDIIAEACNKFSQDLIDIELKDLENIMKRETGYRKNNVEKAIEHLKKIKDEIEKLKNKEFIIRLGKHEGFLSTTINLLLRRANLSLYKEVYPHLVPKGQKNIPNKTRKITSQGYILGWCLIYPQDHIKKKPDSNKKDKYEKNLTAEDLAKHWGGRFRK
ncbi:type III-A CRISPR-associated RAMP protein Csm5 [Persephonella sp.]